MKKRFLLTSIFASLSMVFTIGASVFVSSNKEVIDASAWSGNQSSNEGDYYKTINTQTGSSLSSALAAIKPVSSCSRAYTNERAAACDEAEGDSSYAISLYTRHNVLKSKASGTYSWETWNKEHIWPQGSYGSSKTDVHNYFVCEGKINNYRSSFPFGEVNHNSSTRLSVHGHELDCYLENKVFEPCDDAKGEVARSLMYGTVNYGHNLSNMISPATALKWHLEHPVTNRDIFRNNTAYGIQGNRNPFVDHPEYACRIWGLSGEGKAICDSHPTTDPVAPTSFTLSDSVISLIIDGTKQLSIASVSPSDASKNVTWSSSNSSVASVGSNGLVTAKGVGSAVITATSVLDSNISSSCTVNVSTPQEVELESINASVSPSLVSIGGTATVSVSSYNPSNSYPHPTYTYESGNTSIATVNAEGTVSAVAAGSTSITVKAYQGSVLKASTSLTVQVYEGGSSTTFEKVSSNLTDFSGRYLITNASETSATVLDGSNPGPASSNHFTASVSSGKIEHTGNKYFDIVKSGSNYAIKGTNNMYIGSGSSNTLTTSESPLETTISVSDGSATITHNGKVLRYNTASGGLFRYYSSGQQPITLFKASQSAAGDPKIGLDKTELTLVNGQSESIEATTLLGEGVVSWSISDDSVIQLDDIEDKSVTVNAIKEGTATLTASYDAGASATCEITVGEAPVIATSLVATYSGDSILKGGKLDLSKVSAKLYYSDSTSVDLTASDLTFYIGGSQVSDIANYVFNSVGDVSVTVSNHGLTSSFVIHVVNPSSPDTPVGPGNDTNQDSNIDINNGTNGSGAGQVMPILLIVIFGTAVFAGGFLLVYFLIIKKKR